jgi:predicted NAD-dependent protein-ADP-ribosyltransferase YbiA (DUF1768 family)
MQDTLQFYAFSADKKAGKGSGDVVADETVYRELNEIKNWRRMFSSFWAEDPFTFERKTYLSYEHAYQTAKYKINGYEEIANNFCLESGHEISRLTGKEVQRRIVKLNGKEIEKWDSNVGDIKNAIYRAKFTLNSNPGKALLATKNAILINAGPRIKKIHCTRLEILREELKNDSKI